MWFWDPPSIMITVGGTLASMLVAFPIKKVMSIINLTRLAIFPPSFNYEELMDIFPFLKKRAV
jgi:flagellar motor component MotA